MALGATSPRPSSFPTLVLQVRRLQQIWGSRRVRLWGVVGTKGSAVRCSISGLSAAEAEVLFAGELLGCFIKARDARGCVCLEGRLGSGRGRSNVGAGKGNLSTVGARGFGFARVRVIELDEVLLNPVCTFNELSQCGGRPEVEKLGREGGGKLVADLLTAGREFLSRPSLILSLFHLAKNVSTVSSAFMMRRSMAANAVLY